MNFNDYPFKKILNVLRAIKADKKHLMVVDINMTKNDIDKGTKIFVKHMQGKIC